jgi:hypothetical protein
VQKITVRTLLRAFALAPAAGLGWGWGRGRAKAAPATPVDPLTVDASGVTVKGQLNADKVLLPGLKLEGSGGRNFFLDEESKKEGVDLDVGLRVGSVWNTNGIYSQKGPAVVGSQNNIIMLKGGVSVQSETTKPTGIPEGGIRAKSIGFGEEDLRIIRGVIYQRQSHGRGFTLEAKTKEGLYKIIFTVEFPNDFFTPIATSFSGDRRVQIKETDKKYCIIRVGNVHSNADQDGSFTFMVIGPV